MLPGIRPLPSRPAYRPNAVNFDGTTTVLSRGGGLTGAVDGNSILASFWFKRAVDGTASTVLGGIGAAGAAGSRVLLNLAGSISVVQIAVSNSSGTTIGDIRSSASYNAASGWNHCVASMQMASTATRWLYMNDVPDLATVATYTTGATIDWTLVDWFVSGGGTANPKTNGDLADIMVWPSYLDLSVTANRRLFIGGDKMPVDPAKAVAALGAPIIQLNGPTSGWPTNKGSGGGFSLSGTLADAATRPGG